MTSPLPNHRPAVPPPAPRGGWSATTWLVVGLAVTAALCPVAGFLLWLFAGPDLDEPRAAVDTFLGRLEAGDDAAAYASLCARTKAATTAAEFAEAVRALPRPASHRTTDASFSNEAGTSAWVQVALTDRAAAVRQLSFKVDDEDRAWRVCGDPFE